MKTEPVSSRNGIDVFARILHLGLAAFGLLALVTGDLARDYRAGGLGFFIHSWIGRGIALFIGLRVVYGIWGPVDIRFTNWVPFTKERIQFIWEDITGLAQLRLPERQPRQGLAALVEMLGLSLFFCMAVTGVLLFVVIEPGHRAQGTAQFIKAFHQAVAIGLPIFFLVHGGAVILHAVTGNHLWKKMIFLKEK